MKRSIRWFLGSVLVFALLQGFAPASYAQRQPDLEVQQDKQEFAYFGSRKSNVFHAPNCQYVQRIKSGNVVGFRSRDEAIKMGFRPCRVCKP